MSMTYQSVINMLSPFVLASVVALGGWISKIEDRQYQQKDQYATKVELANTAIRMEQTLAQFVKTYELLRDEDREAFGAAMSRIEARQLETSRKINDIAVVVANQRGS